MRLPWLLPTLLLLAASPSHADERADKKAAKAEKKRRAIDEMAAETLAQVTEGSATAQSLHEQAFGYAVFDNWKTSLVLAGGSGTGVAVARESGDRTYMKMKTVGVKLGLGVQKCQVVFLFRSRERFDRFVTDGWEAEAGSDAALWKEGANLEANWSNDMAMYQITERGLMLSVDLSGTKYHPAKKLN